MFAQKEHHKIEWNNWKNDLLVAVHVLTTGPHPRSNSMVAIGAVAVNVNKQVFGKFRAGIKERKGTKRDSRTMGEFWHSRPHTAARFLANESDLLEPEDAMTAFSLFLNNVVKASEKKNFFLVSDNLWFENTFIDFYAKTYTPEGFQLPYYAMDALSYLSGLYAIPRHLVRKKIRASHIFVNQHLDDEGDPLHQAWYKAGWVVDHIRAAHGMPQELFSWGDMAGEDELNLCYVEDEDAGDNDENIKDGHDLGQSVRKVVGQVWLNNPTIINTSPHDVHLYAEDGKTLIKVFAREKNAKIARLVEQQVQDASGMQKSIAIEKHSVPLVDKKYTAVQDLPEPKENTMYIVSQLVLEACNYRRDLIAPDSGDGAVRNPQGVIIGTKAFVSSVSKGNLFSAYAESRTKPPAENTDKKTT